MTPPAITWDRVTVHLDGDLVLQDVTGHVAMGESVALLGGNGSGKTTLVRASLGLVPCSGTVQLFGEPLPRFTAWRRVGYVPQHSTAAMLNVTVDEAVSSGLLNSLRPYQPLGRARRERVAEAIAEVGLSGRERSAMGHLSGGQRRRALIARGLVSDPDLLVMDEPLAGVDLATQHSLAALVGRIRERGTALITVLHETGTFQHLLDRVITLDAGRVVAGEIG